MNMRFGDQRIYRRNPCKFYSTPLPRTSPEQGIARSGCPPTRCRCLHIRVTLRGALRLGLDRRFSSWLRRANRHTLKPRPAVICRAHSWTAASPDMCRAVRLDAILYHHTITRRFSHPITHHFFRKDPPYRASFAGHRAGFPSDVPSPCIHPTRALPPWQTWASSPVPPNLGSGNWHLPGTRAVQ